VEVLAKRKRRGRIWVTAFSIALVTLILISFGSILVAQKQTSAASIRLVNRAKEIELAEVGFRVATPLTAAEMADYNLTSDPRNDYMEEKVYWGQDRVDQRTLLFIIGKSGHDALSLTPVTTREYKKDDDIKLYRSFPEIDFTSRHVTTNALAGNLDYFGFTVLFKIKLRNDTVLSGYPFYFEHNSRFQGYNDVDHAIRLGFESSYRKDIIRPIAASGSAYTESSISVGGRLDLDRQLGDEHHFYDYTTYPDDDGKFYEIAYGDFEHALTDEHWESNPAGAIDPEVTGVVTKPGIHALKVDEVTPKRAYFKNSFRYYSYVQEVGQQIAFTDEEGIAELDIKIWLEGWDPAATDDVDGINFEADIGFLVRDKDL
ncbi:MAG TPA: hypothetical protein VFD05_00090, partial [Bacilli bacterium]|nr:hypothetical protein [Bacilli bacterium]